MPLRYFILYVALNQSDSGLTLSDIILTSSHIIQRESLRMSVGNNSFIIDFIKNLFKQI